MMNVVMLSVILPNVVVRHAACHYAKCRYAECRGAYTLTFTLLFLNTFIVKTSEEAFTITSYYNLSKGALPLEWSRLFKLTQCI